MSVNANQSLLERPLLHYIPDYQISIFMILAYAYYVTIITTYSIILLSLILKYLPVPPDHIILKIN